MASRSSFGISKKPAARHIVQGKVHLSGLGRMMARQPYTPAESLAEFIDNSHSARVGDDVMVEIDIVKEPNGKHILRIIDNGRGVGLDEFEKMFSYAFTMGGGDNNEHGAGMKQAAFSGGTHVARIESKTAKGSAYQTNAPLLKPESWMEAVTLVPGTRKSHGSTFDIALPAGHALLNKERYYDVLRELQRTYQKILGSSLMIQMGNTALNIAPQMLVPDSAARWVQNPVYDNATWLAKDHALSGNGWNAVVNVGYIEQQDTPRLLRKKSNGGVKPSDVSMYEHNQQGVYIFKGGRLIANPSNWKCHPSLPKAFVSNASEDLNGLIVEVIVDQGISTVPTKNSLADPTSSIAGAQTPLTELQQRLSTYLNKVRPQVQQDIPVVNQELLAVYGAAQLSNTIKNGVAVKNDLGPASLDWSTQETSWRAGWKGVKAFGEWKIWHHPLHDVVMVMHKKGIDAALVGGDIPNYGVLQDHIETSIQKVPSGIILAHAKHPWLQQADVPSSRAVHIVESTKAPETCVKVAKSKLTVEEALPALPSLKLNDMQRSLLAVSMASQTKYSLEQTKEWLGATPKGVVAAKALLKKPGASILKTIGTQEQYKALKKADSVHEFRRVIDAWGGIAPSLSSPASYSASFKASYKNRQMHRRKEVVCLDTGIKYNSPQDACEWIDSYMPDNPVRWQSFKMAIYTKSKFRGLQWEMFDPTKIYSPTNPSAIPRYKRDHHIVCLDTAQIFDSAQMACAWISNHPKIGSVYPSMLMLHIRNGTVYKGLHWDLHDNSKKYKPLNMNAKPSKDFTGREIICLETGDLYNSIAEASKWLHRNLKHSSLVQSALRSGLDSALSNGSAVYKGLTWAFYEPTKQYKPTDKNAKPSAINGNASKKVICLDTGRIFGSMKLAHQWVLDSLRESNPSVLADIRPLSATLKTKDANLYKGLQWEYYDASKKYKALNPKAVPIDTTQKVYCINLDRTFANLGLFTKWLENNERKTLDWNDVAAVAAGKNDKIMGYSVVLEHSTLS